MKYIRTKDGHLYEIGKNIGVIGKPNAIIVCDCNGNFIDVEEQNMILKQADTIKDLCDEFVWDEDICYIDFEKKTLKIKEDDYEFDLGWCIEYSNVYGAIWTDKGLIYVAKMNDNGELELI